MTFAAVAGQRSGRAAPSLRAAPPRQSMETTGRETIYRNRNAVQTKPATSIFPYLSGVCNQMDPAKVEVFVQFDDGTRLITDPVNIDLSDVWLLRLNNWANGVPP